MKRLMLKSAIVALLIPSVVILWLLFSESALQWAFQRALPYLPGQLHITQLEGRLTGPITLNGLRYQYEGTQISAEQLVINWHPGALLGGAVDITQLHGRKLTVTLADTPRTEPLTLPDIDLPWRLAVRDVQLDELHFKQGDQEIAINQIKLDAKALFNRIDIDQLRLSADSYTINLTGRLNPSGHYRHQLEVNWRYRLPSNLQQSHLKQRIDGPLQLTLNADLYDLLQSLHWQATLKAHSENLALLENSLPTAKGSIELNSKGDLNSAQVSGQLTGNHPDTGPLAATFTLQRQTENTIEIERLQLQAPNSHTRINARGHWQPGADGGNVELTLDWQQLRWPLSGAAWFHSALGSGWLTGNLNEYEFGIATDRPWPQAPPSDWYASGQGNLDGIEFHSLRLDTMAGETEAKGQLRWRPQLQWQASVTLADINPASLLPEWPGKLQGRLDNQGRYGDGQLTVVTELDKLSGTLRDYPVDLQGRFEWRDNGLDIDHAELHAADSTVTLHGRAADTLDLNWTLNATDLATLYPKAQGALTAKGRLAGPLQAPVLEANLKGDGLAFADYAAAHLQSTLQIDPQHWQRLDVDLSAQQVTFAGQAINTLRLIADDRQLQLNADLANASIRLALQGEMDDQQWRGTIKQADVAITEFGLWQLNAATSLRLSPTSITLDTPCWVHDDAQLCLNLQGDENNLRGSFKLRQLPLALLTPWLPPELDLNGTSDGEGRFNYARNAPFAAQAKLTLAAGSVTYPLVEGAPEQWHYQGGSLEATQDETGIEAQADLAVTNEDHLRAHLRLPQAQLPSLEPDRQPVKGSARVEIHDLGLLEALLPEIQDLQGVLAIRLDIGGTLDQPSLTGQADLNNGSLRVPRLGLTIDPLALHGQINNAQLDFRLDARSGDGQLTLKGMTKLEPAAGWPTEITIKGENFEAAKIPEARVQISPDLTVQIQSNNVRTEGSVHIPYAKIQPKDVTTAVHESEDTVIIGGEQTTEEKWKIYTHIRLTLGERVQFYGFGFEGKFGGSLLLEDEPGQLTKATGELNVPEGRYRAYGQRLDVERGRLLYTGGPLTNPGLDFRSVRKIGTITAGLHVRGTVNQPQIELFSVPAMGETDTLSYLLLGRPIETASGEEGAMMAKATLALGLSGGDRLARTLGDRFGLDEMRIETSETEDQAALVMGRYLSPKLYISYGVGLIDAVNVFSVRYQISDKWQLKGESGEHQGADLLYTIER